MKLRKPAALKRNETIAVLAPSSPVEPERLRQGMRELEAIGYHVVLGRTVFARRGFFAGEHQQRAEEFLAFVEDPKVRAIFCARGGYGSNYVVEALSSRALLPRLKRQPPKIVMGYSDVTSLLLFLQQTLGWVTFQGPMVAREFCDGEIGYNRLVMERVLSQAATGCTVESGGWSLQPGVAEGRLLGGCLPMLTATLGTPQEVDTRGAILLLEDIDERPFRIDRLLFHLRRAGKFRGIRGVIFGQMPGCGQMSPPGEALREVIAEAFANLSIPIVFGLPFGHASGKSLTLPLGVRARLSAGDRVELDLLEPAVIAPAKKPRRRNR